MKIKKTYIITSIITITIFLCIITGRMYDLKKNVWDLNSKLFKNQVLSIGKTVETVNLTKLTPFEWDNVYSFYPYTSKEKIYKEIGYEWDNITEAMSEGIFQIVFVKERM